MQGFYIGKMYKNSIAFFKNGPCLTCIVCYKSTAIRAEMQKTDTNVNIKEILLSYIQKLLISLQDTEYVIIKIFAVALEGEHLVETVNKTI